MIMLQLKDNPSVPLSIEDDYVDFNGLKINIDQLKELGHVFICICYGKRDPESIRQMLFSCGIDFPSIFHNYDWPKPPF